MTATAAGAPGIAGGRVGTESGYWIRNQHIEAFVTAQARIRILVLRRPGGSNLLSATGAKTDGLRCWLMSPNDNEAERDDLASCAGRLEPRGGRLHAETPRSPKLGFTLSWTVSIDTESATVTVDHRVANRGAAAREIAVWPVIGIAPGARLVLPFSQEGDRATDARRLYHFPWSALQDPRISAGTDHVQLEIRDDGADAAHIKFGVHQPTGSGAALIGDSVLVTHTEFEPGLQYPEGGPNLTVYASPAVPGTAVGELENVGALHLLRPDDSVTLRQSLTVEGIADSPFLRSLHYPGTA